MARRTFFSFDFEHDVFRANQVRNVNIVGVERAGYYDHSEYEEAKKKGPEAIRRMILAHLKDTTVTVVLLGSRTATRSWVQFEIRESIRRGNGLLGIRIHHLLAPPAWDPFAPRTRWTPSLRGPLPVLPPGIVFPVYAWNHDLDRFARAIEAAGKRADATRAASVARVLSPPPSPAYLPVDPPARNTFLPVEPIDRYFAPPPYSSLVRALSRYQFPPPPPSPLVSAIELIWNTPDLWPIADSRRVARSAAAWDRLGLRPAGRRP
ncbi:MAG TPA: TIR domain-containing protein [Vicinamibacteria bacterium]|nr:TIR domain-containing protein [Vicinamibacteria bacterium]